MSTFEGKYIRFTSSKHGESEGHVRAEYIGPVNVQNELTPPEGYDGWVGNQSIPCTWLIVANTTADVIEHITPDVIEHIQ